MSDQDLTQAGVAESDEAAVPLEEALAGAEEKRAARKRASELAAGLRSLATMLEENPELAEDAAYLRDVNVWWVRDADRLAAIARTALRYGAKVQKEITESQHNVLLKWGPFGASALAERAVVCERMVTGTREVTKKVKDPAALKAVPEVEVTETVEDVEWVCRPLLAATGEAGGSDA